MFQFEFIIKGSTILSLGERQDKTSQYRAINFNILIALNWDCGSI